jgi:checkpoint serine/threonine-protein kinase
LNQQNQRSSKIPLQQEEEAATMAECEIQKIDPETEFLLTKRETGNEWETFKENVRPLKRGRNVNILNNALKSNTDNHLKKSLLDQRRFFSN